MPADNRKQLSHSYVALCFLVLLRCVAVRGLYILRVGGDVLVGPGSCPGLSLASPHGLLGCGPGLGVLRGSFVVWESGNPKTLKLNP